jgi:hypothetical protein
MKVVSYSFPGSTLAVADNRSVPLEDLTTNDIPNVGT